ncbi:MAG TPA: hypothetical protein VIB39_00935 [Candidatus Angelobacter sp.]|jgi:hypothetical protein
MKRSAFLLLCLCFSFLMPATIAGQEQPQGCQFNIAGTWQSSTGGQLNPTRERFGSNGVITELSRNSSDEWKASGKSRYKLDDPKKPKAMTVTTKGKDGHGPESNTTVKVETFDDGMFVTKAAGEQGGVTRWTRVDPYRYFVVLVAGKGDPGFGAAGFAMLIKTDGVHMQTDALGSYPVVTPHQRYAVFGEISEEIRKQYEKDPVDDSGSMFRLEVTAGPYNRALEVLKTWQRRVDEDQVLYPTIPYLNNAVYLNQLTSSLNETGVLTWKGGTTCAETIKLQKLTWLLSDPIMAKHNLTQTPYYLFKTLHELNAPLHLSDSQFHAALAGEQSAPVAISSR